MWFWIFMLVMNLMIPLAMIGFGKLFMHSAPKSINPLFGYRTTMSMKNKDTWEFAHVYFGKLSFRIGWILLPVSMIPLLFVMKKSTNTIGIVGGVACLIQIVFLLRPIISTEKALKNAFDEEGNRK